MSEAHLPSTGSPQLPETVAHGDNRSIPVGSAPQRSFAEQFLDSFFQERNIKWMLIVGAALVFGSSLMLVTSAWPSWSAHLKYLTILGYTAATFGVAEVGRKRLGLTATYKVLHALTLLLLPVCFMSLTWLSSARDGQSALHTMEVIGLMIPATAFLWFASSQILDHLLRGRQTTFLICYQLLCMAGALRSISDPASAFAFMTACWLVLTAGVVKVSRHTFWLAEEHRLPRVFGFLPVAMLGLQFMFLVATKTIHLTGGSPVSTIPIHWLGLGCVMAAATILLTARAVADVFRQRTGDLIRPLPWNIIVPLFCGLVMTAVGVLLSFSGFSYTGTTTYAVIPTAAVAAFLMWITARDTRHVGFLWVSLICAAIAYQCSPTLFADIVRQLKEGVADAIHEDRLPVAFYGLTYLPLLLTVAIGSRLYARRSDFIFSRTMKRFVTIVSLGLFCAAIGHTKALFFVSLVNILVFLVLAMLFADRRYVLVSIGALVLAAGYTIPALNGMQLHVASLDYVPTVLAGLATILTATRLPDHLLNRIPVCTDTFVRHRNPHTGVLTERSVLLQQPDGTDRGLCQLAGCVLAGLVAIRWLSVALLHFQAPLNPPAVLEFVLLMIAFVLYTVRNPHYFNGMCIWGLIAFASVHSAVGHQIRWLQIAYAASLVTAASSLSVCLWLKLSGQITGLSSLSDVRRKLGVDSWSGNFVPIEKSDSVSWMRQAQAIIVPLCDLSLITLSCLAVFVHLPILLKGHASVFSRAAVSGELPMPTTVTVLWLAVATVVLRSRAAGIAASIAVPLWVSAALLAAGVPLTAEWLPVLWAAVAGTAGIICCLIRHENDTHPVDGAIANVSKVWLQGVLFFSCLSFALPLRLAAAIALGCFLYSDRRVLNRQRMSFYAIAANIQILLLAAGLGGASGLIVDSSVGLAVLPFIFFAAAFSVLLCDQSIDRFDRIVMLSWTAILRAGMVLLALLSLAGPHFPGIVQAVMVAGFAAAAAAEVSQAVRRQQEFHVWTACAVSGMAAIFLFDQGIINFTRDIDQFVLLAIAVAALVVAKLSQRYGQLAITRRPMLVVGQTLPTLVAVMAVYREAADISYSRSANSLALMLAAGIYFQQAMVTRRRRFAMLAAGILNIALMLLWWSMEVQQLEFYMVPIGLTILGFVELLKKELPQSAHDPLRYIGALTILVSPALEVFGGNWAHIIALMVLSVAVILLAIGLRLRALVYTGSAFLLADLVAMVIRSRMEYPFMPWLCGIALGAAVIGLAAFCENHREQVLSKIRMVSAELSTWR